LERGAVTTGLLQQTSLTMLLIVLLGSFSPALFSPTRSTIPDIHVTPPPVVTAITKPTVVPTPLPTAAPTPAPAKRAQAGVGVAAGALAAGVGVGRQPFGVAAGLARLPEATLNAQLDAMKAIGVTWVRFDLEWSNIQYAGPDSWDWTDYDRVVNAVHVRGLKALGILDYTPDWARRAECSGSMMCAPADPGAYAAFAAAAAGRYKSLGMHAWEIWNEPNNVQFYQPAADPGAYAALLAAAYPAIHGADPAATVVTGGLSPAQTGGGDMSPPDFLAGVYAAGGQGHFDAVGDHPYSWPFTATSYAPGGAWSQLTTLHDQMVAHGDGGKKIWLTEYGAPTGGDGAVSEALQAQIVTDAANAVAALAWTGPLFWYTWQDDGGSGSIEDYFGLLRQDGSPKPALAAYQSSIASH